ncbi:glutamate-1-semialdehyde 2,1-aminomutase [bacterium]|nr:glutamate-1-semialdehyde 2,1-aminomutase [bacterium]
MKRPLSEELFITAQKIMPGGVNSPVRSFASVGGHPFYVEKGKGAKITDADGNSYIDYVMSWGPLIFGHAHPDILAKIEKTLHNGTSFGACSGFEIELAKLVTQSVPSVEKVRFVNSGTEACMSAIRLARGYTGRKKILKFNGCYHGHADAFLVEGGSGVATLGIPGSPGVPQETVQDTMSISYNDLDLLEKTIKQSPKDYAAIIVEPIAGNMGLVEPKPGFLQAIRKLCDDYGIVCIFDEVMTGFRVHKHSAQGLYDIKPDLTCLGKIIGGGMPVGAYGGKKKIMDYIAPLGPVYQAGTLSGNPVCMAAGIKTLKMLKEESPYETLEHRSRYLQEELEKEAQKAGVAVKVNRVGSMLTLFFSEHDINDFESSKQSHQEKFSKYFQAMLEQGVYLPPSAFECWFISTAHDESILQQTIAAHKEALQKI